VSGGNFGPQGMHAEAARQAIKRFNALMVHRVGTPHQGPDIDELDHESMDHVYQMRVWMW